MFLDCLAGGKELRKVYVDGNKLYDLNWLKESKNLRVLSASQNRISSLTDLGIGMELRYLNLAENNLESIASGDLVFGEDNYLVVDLRNNRLQTLELPQNCTYTQLAVLGNPELDIGTLKALKGGELFFELFPELTVQKLEALSFNYLCIVNCPLDRQVEMEEHFYSAKLLTQEEALEQIAENAENATY